MAIRRAGASILLTYWAKDVAGWLAPISLPPGSLLPSEWMSPCPTRNKSHAAFARAKQLMPGGVNSPARAFGGVGGEPIFFERGAGAYLFDIDGNRYIDYIGSWGPMILGHAHPAVVAAVESGRSPRHQLRRADRGRKRAGRVDHRGRAVGRKSAAGQLGHRGHDERHPPGPRIHRPRTMIVKFAGNYHGHVDSLLVAAGSSAATLGVPNSPGVTAGTARDTLVLPYNDPAGLEAAFGRARPADRRRDRRAGRRQHGLRDAHAGVPSTACGDRPSGTGRC